MKYKISQYAKIHGVTNRTVWYWIYANKVKFERDLTNHIWIIEEEPYKSKTAVVYARVSSSENKSNLDIQAERVKNWAILNGYSIHNVIKEVGSGLNDQRSKLEKILKDPSIDYIIVEHKDRLTRFGFNYIQNLLKTYNREIIVINNAEDDKQDLIQDFISVITSFCARIYGQRRSKRNTEKLLNDLNITSREKE